MRRSRYLLVALVILHAVPLLAQGKLPVWTATAELRIDGAAEDLSGVSWVGVSPHGIVAILQPQDNRVLFFDSAGKRTGSFGRAGEGPGEFRGMGQLGWVGDTLWIGDDALRRTTFITPQFKPLRDVPDPPPADPGPLSDNPCLLRRRGGGTLTNLLCAHAVSDAAPDSSRMATVTQSNPTSSNGSYTVTVTRHNGAKVFSRSYMMNSVPIPSSMTDLMASRAGPAGPETKAFLQKTMPAYFQPVRVAFVGTDGTTWLWLSAAPGVTTWQYVVLGSTGDPLATVTLPTDILPQVVSRNIMWGVQTDADGIGSVVRYRVQ